MQPNCPLSLFNEQEISAPTGSSGAELAARLAGGTSRSPGWAATCTTSIEDKKDWQWCFICLGQKGTLGEPCFAAGGSLSSHIRAVQHLIIVLHSLNERSVRGAPKKADATLKGSHLKPGSPDSSTHIVPWCTLNLVAFLAQRQHLPPLRPMLPWAGSTIHFKVNK